MSRVTYNLDNLNKCQCPYCPLHQMSKCIVNKMQAMKVSMPIKTLPSAEALEGLYCSAAVGPSACDDLDSTRACICPTCAVWAENSLTSNYYCLRGAEEDVERMRAQGKTNLRMGGQR
ncbi:MAG: DUF2769 domain-containing protein [Chloroflexota bacterium]